MSTAFTLKGSRDIERTVKYLENIQKSHAGKIRKAQRKGAKASEKFFIDDINKDTGIKKGTLKKAIKRRPDGSEISANAKPINIGQHGGARSVKSKSKETAFVTYKAASKMVKRTVEKAVYATVRALDGNKVQGASTKARGAKKIGLYRHKDDKRKLRAIQGAPIAAMGQHKQRNQAAFDKYIEHFEQEYETLFSN